MAQAAGSGLGRHRNSDSCVTTGDLVKEKLSVGIVLLIVCIIGNRGAQTVNLGLVEYFWAITVFIAPILIGMVAFFYFCEFLSMWFTHSCSNYALLGQLFCHPYTGKTCKTKILLIAPSR